MYSNKVTLSELELSQSNINNNTITKIKLKCDHCNIPIRRFGLIYIIPIRNIAVFFCSCICRKLYKENKLFRTCFNCDTEIPKNKNTRYCSDICASAKYNKTFKCQHCNKIAIDKSSRIKSIRKFCTRKCANASNLTKYKDHYFCDMCHTYIKKSDAKTFKAKVKTYLVCSKPSCNNNKLRVRARRSNAKDKESKKFYYDE
jgi:hypothetical protein